MGVEAVRIVILGCGRVGSTLAAMLTREGHHVAVIDRDQAAFDKAVQRLGPDFTQETVRGIGIDEDVLRQAGIEEADAFVSVTSGDNTNIVAAQIARQRFHVPKVVARVYDPIRAEAYREAGVATVCTTTVGAGILHDLLLGRSLPNVQQYLDAVGPGPAHPPEGG
jgi:trk system potassium uptake protein TrkA